MKKADLLLEIFKKCYEISTGSKCDIFFDYSPHVNTYSIYYYLDGWEINKKAVYLHPNFDISEDINIKNLKRSIKELDKLWLLIEENNLKIH